jgi:hypothetical protein
MEDSAHSKVVSEVKPLQIGLPPKSAMKTKSMNQIEAFRLDKRLVDSARKRLLVTNLHPIIS